jgi:hypothetical protein
MAVWVKVNESRRLLCYTCLVSRPTWIRPKPCSNEAAFLQWRCVCIPRCHICSSYGTLISYAHFQGIKLLVENISLFPLWCLCYEMCSFNGLNRRGLFRFYIKSLPVVYVLSGEAATENKRNWIQYGWRKSRREAVNIMELLKFYDL